jgi:hypoxanthine-guanine phosphoribosyltransferase
MRIPIPCWSACLKELSSSWQTSSGQSTFPVEVDFIAISSYSPETRGQGVRTPGQRPGNTDPRPASILFVEDVIDTGLTLNYILQNSARAPTRKPGDLRPF